MVLRRKLPAVHVWRGAHGAQAQRGETKVPEPCADGVRRADPDLAAAHRQPRGKPFTSETAREAALRKWELSKLPDFNDSTATWMPPAKDMAPFDEARKDLLKQRRSEITEVTGACSSGVGAQLRGWSYLHAAAEYWASKFFATGDSKAFDNMTRAFKAASTEDAKLRDAAVWEAEARRPQDPIADLDRRLGITTGGDQ